MSKTPPTQSVPKSETGHVSEAARKDRAEVPEWIAFKDYFEKREGFSPTIGDSRVEELYNYYCVGSFDSASPWIKAADTQRLDWLEKNGGWLGDENLKAKWTISIPTPDRNLSSPTPLREAIDAARGLSADVKSSSVGRVSNPKSDVIPPVPQQQKKT